MDNPLHEALIESFPRVDQGRFPLPSEPGVAFTPHIEQAPKWLVGRHSFQP